MGSTASCSPRSDALGVALVYIFAPSPSGIARGASGGTCPGVQALEANQHTFYKHLKTRFKQKFRPNVCLKMRIFWKKL